MIVVIAIFLFLILVALVWGREAAAGLIGLGVIGIVALAALAIFALLCLAAWEFLQTHPQYHIGATLLVIVVLIWFIRVAERHQTKRRSLKD